MNKKEYNELVKEINHHMDLYYNQDTPIISDYEYDKLMMKLKEVEKENPSWVKPTSPTQKVGGIVKRESGIKVTHNVPMLSIEDVFDKEKVKEWVCKVKAKYPNSTFSVEAKIDGLSATLRYKRGEDNLLHLTMCETRGDGYIGEDVTPNALVIDDVQKTLDLPLEELEIRGEVYMSHKDFEAYNQLQEKLGNKIAQNPRNLAAGTLRQLDPNVTKERKLKMFIFNIQQSTPSISLNHIEGLEYLSKANVPTTLHRYCKNEREVIEAIDEIGNMRGSLEYDIDGCVIKINEIDLRDDFQSGSKYSSGHIAFKYPPEEKIVVIDDIAIDVGRTGVLSFTAIFHDKETNKPARLCGTNVSRATIHNQDYINKMQIGIGGEYKLFKSGEIIPKLNGCVKPPINIFKAPSLCPICHEPLEREEDTNIRCVNQCCPAQLVRSISYFASQGCMNIVGLGETLVEALIEHNYLSTYADIYTLKNHKEQLIKDNILGREKNTNKILNAIEKSKENDGARLLVALGIKNVGNTTTKDIAKHFSSIDDLANATKEDLLKIDDIGEITSNNIVEFFNHPQNKEVYEKLKKEGLNITLKNQALSKKLEGKTIVISGTLPTLKREQATKLIEDNGGKCATSVSKKTSYLLSGEKSGSKLTKAQSLNVPIIDEEKFLEMLK